MGVDVLDLVFRLEKKFGLKIPAEECVVFFETPRKIHGYLMAKINGELLEIPCLDLLLMEVHIAVNRVGGWWRLRTARDMNKFFKASHRQACWSSLEKELRITLPPLVQSPQETEPRIPPECSSIWSLAHWIADNYPDRVEWMPANCERSGKMAGCTWSEDEVWEILQGCIVDALGVDVEEVTPDARLVEDLGMG